MNEAMAAASSSGNGSTIGVREITDAVCDMHSDDLTYTAINILRMANVIDDRVSRDRVLTAALACIVRELKENQ